MCLHAISLKRRFCECLCVLDNTSPVSLPGEGLFLLYNLNYQHDPVSAWYRLPHTTHTV